MRVFIKPTQAICSFGSSFQSTYPLLQTLSNRKFCIVTGPPGDGRWNLSELFQALPRHDDHDPIDRTTWKNKNGWGLQLSRTLWYGKYDEPCYWTVTRVKIGQHGHKDEYFGKLTWRGRQNEKEKKITPFTKRQWFLYTIPEWLQEEKYAKRMQEKLQEFYMTRWRQHPHQKRFDEMLEKMKTEHQEEDLSKLKHKMWWMGIEEEKEGKVEQSM